MLLAGAGCVLAVPAAAKTYTGTRTVSSTTINLSITTDGTFGTLAAPNITGWNIVDGTNPVDDFTFTTYVSPGVGNSKFVLNGSALSATATSLTFNFSSPIASLFEFYEFPINNDFEHLYCVATIGACANYFSGEEAVSALNGSQGFFAVSRTGRMTLATSPNEAGAVPEPATWAVMILGFGLSGMALRRRARSGPALA